MNRKDLLENIADYSPKEIAEAIRNKVVTFYELRAHSNITPLVQRKVREILTSGEVAEEPQPASEVSAPTPKVNAPEEKAPAVKPAGEAVRQPATPTAENDNIGGALHFVAPPLSAADSSEGHPIPPPPPPPPPFLTESVVPPIPSASTPKLKSFSWGGFVFGWLWGVFNGVYWSLLTLMLSIISTLLKGLHHTNPTIVLVYAGYVVLLLNFVLHLILGITGKRSAWKSKSYESVEKFEKKQRGWNTAALVVFLLIIVFIVTYSIIHINS